MQYEAIDFQPQYFSKFLVARAHLTRIVAYCDSPGLKHTHIGSYARIIRQYMKANRIRKAVYGLALNANLNSDDQVYDCVTTTSRGDLTCAWALHWDEQDQDFYGCHTCFRCKSTFLFEQAIRQLLERGYTGNAERKQYPGWLDLIHVRLNPIMAMNVYRPDRYVRNVLRELQRNR